MNKKVILFITIFMMIFSAYAQEETERKELTIGGWIGTVVVIGIVAVLTVALIGLTAFCECADLERYHIE